MGIKFLHDTDADGEVKGTSLDINGNADISGNLTGVDTLTAQYGRFTSTGDASVGGTTHAFQTGTTAGTNIIIDNNEIMARSNGAVSSLNLNPDGGNVDFHTNTGNTSGIDASGNATFAGSVTATSLDINGNADISGNITSAGWTGDVIASSYLDSDTAHLSTTQTFTGTKTFDRLYESYNGTPITQLGTPSVRDVGLFDSMYSCKTDASNNYNDLTDLVFYKQDADGDAWDTVTISDDEKRRFLRGAGSGVINSNIVIPHGTFKYRVEFHAKGYTAVGQFYLYSSYNGNPFKLHMWAQRTDTDAWEQKTSSDANVAGWPGHTVLPFSTIWFQEGASSSTKFDYIRLEFTPSWDHASNDINLYHGSLWGGYPAGRRTQHYYDQNDKIFLPGDANIAGALTLGTALADAEIASAATWNTAYGWGDHGLSAQDKTDIGNLSGTNTGDQTTITGNAGTVTNGVYTTGDQTIGGIKTFSSDVTIDGDVTIGGKFTHDDGIDFERWGSTYVNVNVNAPTPLLTDDGSALPTGGAYRMVGHISGTGTEQVSTAIFWNEDGTWNINKTFEGGTSSNHVEFKLLDHGSGSVPTITLETHTSNYNIEVQHERIALGEGTGTDNLRGYFGSDSYLSWLESTNTLTIPGDVNVGDDLTVSGGDIILVGTGRIQGIDTVTDGTDAANKTYVDTAESDAVATAASANKAWSTITGTPTTIAGYGITDALVIGTTGTTALAGNTTIPAAEAYTAHENITAATSVNGSGRTYIQDITVDSNGHVTGIATASETVTDTNTQNSAATTRAMFSGSGINTTTGVITNTTYGAATAEARGVIYVGDGLSVTEEGVLSVPTIAAASSSTDGSMSSGDKVKLDAIAALADRTSATNVAAAGASMKTAVETISGAKTFSAAATMSSGLGVTGNIAVSGTVDGIDIATDVAANTAKTGITGGQTSAITANTAKNTSSNIYGSTIKLIPSDFETSGDGGNTKFGTAFDKTAGASTYGMRTSDSLQHVFAFVSIPEGMKATHVEIYGRRTKNVEVFEVQINATTVVSKGTGTCTIPGGSSNVIAITNVSSTATNLLAIEVLTNSSTADKIYGGAVTIAAI